MSFHLIRYVLKTTEERRLFAFVYEGLFFYPKLEPFLCIRNILFPNVARGTLDKNVLGALNNFKKARLFYLGGGEPKGKGSKLSNRGQVKRDRPMV